MRALMAGLSKENQQMAPIAGGSQPLTWMTVAYEQPEIGIVREGVIVPGLSVLTRLITSRDIQALARGLGAISGAAGGAAD
jgi:hypothetical protein